MNACNPAKFGTCIKNHAIHELSRRTIPGVVVWSLPVVLQRLWGGGGGGGGGGEGGEGDARNIS